MTDNMGRDLKVESVLGGVTRDAGTGTCESQRPKVKWAMGNHSTCEPERPLVKWIFDGEPFDFVGVCLRWGTGSLRRGGVVRL